MTHDVLLELRTIAAWVTSLALAWYLLRLTIGIPLALLGAHRGSGAVQRCGVRLVPRGVRPIVARWAAAPALGLGLAVLGGPGLGTAAQCETAGLPTLDRSDICSTQPGVDGPIDRGAPPIDTVPGAATPMTVAAEQRERAPGGITVRAGDSLWSLTAAALGSTSEAQVAEAWPALYHENREVIGPDPGLIHPGTNLREPAGWEGTDR